MMSDVQSTKPLAAVVGENCKRLRTQAGITQDELAQSARLCGLRWRASSVGDFEAGRSAPTLATVITVAVALQMTVEDFQRAGRITIGDLVTFDGKVRVTPELLVPGSTLAQWLAGAVTSPPPAIEALEAALTGAEEVMRGADGVLARSGLAEHRTAKGLSIDAESLALKSFELWGRTFTEERDHRAGPDANKQKRGQVARALRAELEKALKGEF
jgi:transcriptional regulator with XRE-family HTH domain